MVRNVNCKTASVVTEFGYSGLRQILTRSGNSARSKPMTTRSFVFTGVSAILVGLMIAGCSTSNSNTDTGSDANADVAQDAIADGNIPGDALADTTADRPEPLDGTNLDEIEPVDISTDSDTGSDVADVVEPPIPPHGLCGMPSYGFISRDQVGQIVSSEFMYTFEADAINALLEGAGFTAMGPVVYGSTSYRFRYTTQDRGQQVEATGIIAWPVDVLPFTEDLPIILYEHGTTGFSDPCAPSNQDKWMEDGALPAAVASLGFIVVAPDYIGMNSFGGGSTVKHGYLVGEQTAIGAWDAVRGGLQLMESLENHPPASNKVSLWGASQGGHAVLFTGLWAPYYVPEFEVPAVVALVPPTDLMSLMNIALGSINDSTGLFASSAVTMHFWYGETSDLEDAFTNTDPYYFADNAGTYLFPEDKCEVDLKVDLDTATLDMLFNIDFVNAAVDKRWDDIGPWKCYYQENSLATTTVPVLRQIPTLIVYGETDDLVDTPSQTANITTLCGLGFQIDHMECQGAGHTQAALWSMPEQFDWIRARLAGTPVPEEEICKIEAPAVCSATPAK
jgi:hypothetical protein